MKFPNIVVILILAVFATAFPSSSTAQSKPFDINDEETQKLSLQLAEKAFDEGSYEVAFKISAVLWHSMNEQNSTATEAIRRKALAGERAANISFYFPDKAPAKRVDDKVILPSVIKSYQTLLKDNPRSEADRDSLLNCINDYSNRLDWDNQVPESMDFLRQQIAFFKSLKDTGAVSELYNSLMCKTSAYIGLKEFFAIAEEFSTYLSENDLSQEEKDAYLSSINMSKMYAYRTTGNETEAGRLLAILNRYATRPPSEKNEDFVFKQSLMSELYFHMAWQAEKIGDIPKAVEHLVLSREAIKAVLDKQEPFSPLDWVPLINTNLYLISFGKKEVWDYDKIVSETDKLLNDLFRKWHDVSDICEPYFLFPIILALSDPTIPLADLQEITRRNYNAYVPFNFPESTGTLENKLFIFVILNNAEQLNSTVKKLRDFGYSQSEIDFQIRFAKSALQQHTDDKPLK